MGTDADDVDDGWYDLPDMLQCPKCNGSGVVVCYCAGDFCACKNCGEKDCGLCHGEGEATEERATAYLKREREIAAAFAEAFKKTEADKPQPPQEVRGE